MFSTSDTIVAIATPSGRGAMGVVRVSGPAACHVAGAILTTRRALTPRRATFTRVRRASDDSSNGNRDSNGRALSDQVVATYFQHPASYTGEDVVEISAHGSPVVLHQILKAAMDAGARLAEPGEFTLRAFLNGRLDLVQAEAVADLIEAVTPLQARVAFDQLEGTLTAEIEAIDTLLFDMVARFEASIDFPEEGYHFVDPERTIDELDGLQGRIVRLLSGARRGRLIREGAHVVIAGRSNVGKSSLFNALLGTGRAIVTAVPGTTRDFVTEVTDLQGVRVALVDTAGERGTVDPIEDVEREGIERARRARAIAQLVLVVLDRSQELTDVDRHLLDETSDMQRVIVVNKIDLPEAWCSDSLQEVSESVVPISVRSGEGLDRLKANVVEALGGGDVERDTAAVTNIRHIELLERAQQALNQAKQAITDRGGRLSEEFVLADLQAARHAFEEITGKRTADDVLAHIFGRFCIGK
ncbi:MAG TPA: tRNA uridine-5-carboxymethylaminomethyl(34) synthesis GTPase MnmE [Vicinamibacterales bacterium]|jgi:tRNA modification GTPase